MPTKPTYTCTTDPRWACRLTADWTVLLSRLADRVQAPYYFRVEKRGGICREWLRLDPDGQLTIRADYASDGCSMAPDFKAALPGCILHDALRQALELDPTGCPWTRREADLIFRDTLRAHGFSWLGTWLYYLGVAGPFGWLYSKLAAWLRPPTDRGC